MTCKDQYDSFEKGNAARPGEIFDAFKVTASVDKNEGRFGGMETIGVFFRRAEAEKAAKGQDVMGTDGKVERVQAVMALDGHAYMIGVRVDRTYDDIVRAKALAKLSEREKKALGVG